MKQRIIKITLRILSFVFAIFSIIAAIMFFYGLNTFTKVLGIILFLLFVFSSIYLFHTSSKYKKERTNPHVESNNNISETSNTENERSSNNSDIQAQLNQAANQLTQVSRMLQNQLANANNSTPVRQNTNSISKTTAKMKIPELIRLIDESYQIMQNTDNPETLCSRYNFACDNIEELKYYCNQGFCNYSDIDCIALFSDENVCYLITQCFRKYKFKAINDLKTNKGIQKRIDKFWDIINNNVNTEIYSNSRDNCKYDME